MPCQFCHCLGGIHGCAGFTKAFDDKTSTTDGWGFGPPASYPHAEGMLLDDTLVLHTRLRLQRQAQSFTLTLKAGYVVSLLADSADIACLLKRCTWLRF